MLKVTYYLDIVSSWCYYSESTWTLLKDRFGDLATFDWQIALIPEGGLPDSREEEEWYYRRSGTMVAWPTMLNGGWWEPEIEEYIAPNAVAEAAKNFGFHGDEVRLALTRAALEDGQKVGQWRIASEVAAPIVGISPEKIRNTARSDDVLKRIQTSTRTFFGHQITQRPAYVISDEIDDRAVFSGLIKPEPLIAAMESMLADCRAYRSWKAHFGEP